MKLIAPRTPEPEPEPEPVVLTCPQCGLPVDVATRAVLILSLRGPSHASETHVVLCSPKCRVDYWISGATESLFRPVSAKEWDLLTDERHEAESWREGLKDPSEHVDEKSRLALLDAAESRAKEIGLQRAREILCDDSDPRSERDLILSVIELDAHPDRAPRMFRSGNLGKSGADLTPLKEQWQFDHAKEFDDWYKTPIEKVTHALTRMDFEEFKIKARKKRNK